MENYNQLIKKAKFFFDANQFEKAQNCLSNILKNFELDLKTKGNLYLLLADIHTKLNNFKDSNKYYLSYLDLSPNDFIAHNSIANNYSKIGQYKKAEKHYLKAINLNKDYEAAIINLAILFDNLGNKSDALKFYKKAIKINSNNLGVLYNIYKLEKKILDNKKIALIKEYLDSDNSDYFNKASGYFLLAGYENKKKNITNEVFFLEKANTNSFRSKEKVNKEALNYWLNIIPKKFDNFSFIENIKDKNIVKNFYPIFIIGLPRSGSTLTETIISSGKNNILSFGESNLVNWSLLNTHRKVLFNEKSEAILDVNLIQNKLVKSYQNLITNKNGQRVQFIDKSLENFYYINLILKIFPNAKFIHTHRNLEDNIFSIYKEFLNKISWSHSFDNIFSYIDNYLAVIEKVKEKYPDNILSVALEELTIKPEEISKQIYQFCGLKWDQNCLKFEERKNLFSSTASNNQIRAGIQSYNEKKYQNYQFLIKNYKSKYEWF
tara:strand:- start:254 stop:1729 length:1476 start_codon:yes stop_codon:yes gene_type:complete